MTSNYQYPVPLIQMKLPRRPRLIALNFLTYIALSGSICFAEPIEKKPPSWDSAIDFTESIEIKPNLQGDLEGEIAFIQNTLVGPTQGETKRPLLVTDRGALLLFFPSRENSDSYEVVIKQSDGTTTSLKLLDRKSTL